MEKLKPLHSVDRMQNGAVAMKNMMVPKKKKKKRIQLPYDPTIVFLSVYPKELKAGS